MNRTCPSQIVDFARLWSKAAAGPRSQHVLAVVEVESEGQCTECSTKQDSVVRCLLQLRQQNLEVSLKSHH